MVPAVPLVPDLNIWAVLFGSLVAATSLGALLGLVELFLHRRQDAQSRGGETNKVPSSPRIERKAA